MTFRLTISQETVDIQVLENDMETLARLQIGLDEEEGIIYSTVVALTLVPGQPDNHKELIFGIIEAGPDGETWINDGEETKSFLTGPDRSSVLGYICLMAVHVAKAAQPDVISMSTARTFLPAKALSKYGHICKALRDAGYHGGKGDSYHGAEIWMLELKKVET
ncbi:hypothetical protein ACFHYO_10600 [Paracoccus panacisoli]|uniref:Uncharacterized protein n=1 Tax=Paracoccus panacisoli TaxID=1510163 RepID=A0ABV6T5K4_9RHOB